MLRQSGNEALFVELETTDELHPLRFFEQLKEQYGLRHVVYADLLRTGAGFQASRLIHDPNPPLQRLLRQQDIDPLQPFVRLAANLYGPAEIDVNALLSTEPTLDRTLSPCGLGGPGLLVPLISRNRGIAFFFCNSSLLSGWTTPRCQRLRDLTLAATLFHVRQTGAPPLQSPSAGAQSAPVRLTPREREVLSWVAAGKSYWEVGRILGISERTVRHFMANSRAKLDAVSNKQAVALAVASELIDPQDPHPGHPSARR